MIVEWSARFRNYMTGLRQLSDGKPQSAHASMLGMLERVSSTLAIPEHACASSTALSDDLRGIYRWHVGRRGRLFYIVSLQRELVIILHYADTRRAGDPKHDAYQEFRRYVRSSEFDRLFGKLGLTKPDVKR